MFFVKIFYFWCLFENVWCFTMHLREINNWTIPAVKLELKRLGAKTSGNKDVVIKRLKTWKEKHLDRTLFNNTGIQYAATSQHDSGDIQDPLNTITSNEIVLSTELIPLCSCFAEKTKHKVYTVKLVFLEEEVNSANCECVAGAGNAAASKHIAAIMFCLQHYGSTDNTQRIRENELINEASMRLGSNLTSQFTEDEKMANELILKLHKQSIDDGIKDIQNFPAAMHFFKAKPLIDKSRMFKIIQKMPKGAFLHGHNSAMVSSDWVLENITYRPGLKICQNEINVYLFTFKSTNPDCVTPLLIVADERAKSGNNTLFDTNLRRTFDLYTEYPEIEYPDMNTVWEKFDRIFETLSNALRYVPVFINFHNQLLQELVDDNIMYVEIRSSMGNLYDDNREYIDKDVCQLFKDIIDNFKKKNPKFIGAKFIYSTYRKVSEEKLQQKIERYKLFHESFPNLVIGFDLVGQEDFGEPLYKFLPQLLKLSQDTKLFFHAGETNWYGTTTDLNVLDAILLRTKRIGHGYSLVKHPMLWKFLKEHEIAIELNPLSNQILGLVHDLRNHPGAVFIAENIPIVIAGDDPGFWRATGLSYDFYYAYMAFAPYDAGLEILKQLVLNSIKFSILTDEERTKADKLFEEQWNYFIKELIDGNIV